jgi:hypothetical protein
MNGSVAWLRTQTVEGKKTDVSELAGRWRTAHSKIVALGKTESMIADGISVTNLPESLAGLAKAVLEHPVTKQSFGLVPTSIKSVELGKLVVFQRNVNLTYASELQSALGSNATEEDVFHFALPIDGRYDPTTNVGQVGIGPNGVAYAIVSPSNDLRVLGPTILDPSQVSGFDINGRATHIVALAVGYGTNFLSAMRIGSRLILKNGTHRAFALLASGFTHAPMLVEEIPEGEEKEHLPAEVQADIDSYLTAPRPSLLRDYVNDELRIVAHVPRTLRSIRVTVSYEEGGIPGA